MKKAAAKSKGLKILAIDIGGTNVKVLCSGQPTPIKIPSGPAMSAIRMVTEVKKATKNLKYSAVSIGFPGAVRNGRPVNEPHNLGKGWVKFNFHKAFGCPVRMVNDAAMQALGSYKGGRMLFLGLGTGLGSAMIVDDILVPMELAHLRYAKGKTYEEFVGKSAMERYGKKKWRKYVNEVVNGLRMALQADYVVLGGGNAKKLKKLPPSTKLGENANAFLGGFRMWRDAESAPKSKARSKPRARTHTAPARRVVKRRAPAMAAPLPAQATVLGGELSNENPQ